MEKDKIFKARKKVADISYLIEIEMCDGCNSRPYHAYDIYNYGSCQHNGIIINDIRDKEVMNYVRELRDALNDSDLGDYEPIQKPPFNRTDIDMWFSTPKEGGLRIAEVRSKANLYNIEHKGLVKEQIKKQFEQFLINSEEQYLNDLVYPPNESDF